MPKSVEAGKLLARLRKLLESHGTLAIYGPAGSFRTRIALALGKALKPTLYIGTGRHSRLRYESEELVLFNTDSFYEELLELFKSLGLIYKRAVSTIVIDEFLANLLPYRAVLRESYIMRMALTEIHIIKKIVEAGGKVILICGELAKSTTPFGYRYLKLARPALVRLHVGEDNLLIVEERDLADPNIINRRTILTFDQVESLCVA